MTSTKIGNGMPYRVESSPLCSANLLTLFQNLIEKMFQNFHVSSSFSTNPTKVVFSGLVCVMKTAGKSDLMRDEVGIGAVL